MSAFWIFTLHKLAQLNSIDVKVLFLTSKINISCVGIEYVLHIDAERFRKMNLKKIYLLKRIEIKHTECCVRTCSRSQRGASTAASAKLELGLSNPRSSGKNSEEIIC